MVWDEIVIFPNKIKNMFWKLLYDMNFKMLHNNANGVKTTE
jgi:hypothetical protein